MKEKIEVLKSTEVLGKELNIYGSIEEPLFLAKDVATWIGHTDSQKMVMIVDDDESMLRTLFGAGQYKQNGILKKMGHLLHPRCPSVLISGSEFAHKPNYFLISSRRSVNPLERLYLSNKSLSTYKKT